MTLAYFSTERLRTTAFQARHRILNNEISLLSRPSKTCLGKEREARTFLKVVEACNCKGPKFPTRGNKTSRSRSTQSSSSKQRKVPDSSRAVHAQWAMETQMKHQRASLAPSQIQLTRVPKSFPDPRQNPPQSVPRPSKNL